MKNPLAFLALLGACSLLGCASGGPPTDRQPTTRVLSPAESIPASALEGRGAPVPFLTYQAEDMLFLGTLKGPSRRVTETVVEPVAEAVGRRAVDLVSTGDFVEFTLKERTDSLVVRFALPDGNGGKGLRVPLELWVDGTKTRDLTLTSEYSLVYGEFPWSNTPSDGMARHFWDEVAVLIDPLPAGAVVRLQRPATNKAAFCLVDLVDTEWVGPPLAKPEGFLSVADFGAVPNDGKVDNEAIERAQAAAKKQKQGLWLPPGTYDLSEELYPDLVIRGAGMWHTVLKTPAVGFSAVSKTFEVHDLRIEGSTKFRDDSIPAGGFEGKPGKGSLIQNVWITHTKVGVWTSKGTDGLTVRGARIRNTTADGVNLAYGARNCVVEDSSFRGTGDDSIAAWSTTEGAASPNENNVIRRNTVEAPWLASGIALYGGKDTLVEDNVVYDTGLNGSGIDLSVRFATHPFSGTITVRRNTLIRSGSLDGDGGRHGALWIDGRGASSPGKLVISDLQIYDSTLAAIAIQGPAELHSVFDGVLIDGTPVPAIKILEDAAGTTEFHRTVLKNTPAGGLKNGSSLIVTLGEGNEGL